MSIEIVSTIAASIVAVGFAVLSGFMKVKQKKTNDKAKTLSANHDLYCEMLLLIVEAEKAYNGFTNTIKGSDIGTMKFNYVFNGLQTYALTNKYKFDSTMWTDEINDIIALTKKVNAKSN